VDDEAGVPRALSFIDEYQLCPDCGTSLWVLTRAPGESETVPRKSSAEPVTRPS
jgi:hypothetical protein